MTVSLYVRSAYVKSTSVPKIQKRDRMIKQLSSDLKRERKEVKKKDGALQKYEAFYREVKARSKLKGQEQERMEQQQQQRVKGLQGQAPWP